MRLLNISRSWRIHGLIRDFRLYDVWALPTPGGPDDFPRLVRQVASVDPSDGSSRAGRALWALRAGVARAGRPGVEKRVLG